MHFTWPTGNRASRSDGAARRRLLEGGPTGDRPGPRRDVGRADSSRSSKRAAPTASRKESPMTTRESDLNPFLQGNFAPWRMEGDADDLEVVGEIPRDLNGTYYRNGPNPAYEPRRPLPLVRRRRDDPRDSSRRRPGVLSQPLREERRSPRGAARRQGDSSRACSSLSTTEAPRFKNTANTNIVSHAGKLLALVESSLPTAARPRHAGDGRRLRLRRHGSPAR